MSRTIVMVHGMWGGGHVWRNLRPYFEHRGFTVHTPDLRHHAVAPDTPPPSGLATVSLLDYAADLEAQIRALPEAPVLIGHSMGSLLVQMLAARGLGKAAILLTPAAPSGIIAIRFSVLRAFMRILGRWAFWRRAHRMDFGASRYAMLNCMPEDQARGEHARFVHESGRALAEIAFWYLDAKHAARANPKNVTCKMLVVAGDKDRITPASVCRAVARRYRGADYREYAGHSHFLISEPGWQDIAADLDAWLTKALA